MLLGFCSILKNKPNLMSWIRDTLKGDIAGLASDFLLSESRSIPKISNSKCRVSDKNVKPLICSKIFIQ